MFFTIQDCDFGVNFDENTKAIALLFGKNHSIFSKFQMFFTIQDCDFGVNFDENTKAIALPFD